MCDTVRLRGVKVVEKRASGVLCEQAGAPSRSPLPDVTDRTAWIKHNALAHVAIGLFPSARAFHWHDRTAREMRI